LAFIKLGKSFSYGGPQGFLRLEQSQALGEHIAFGEKSPLGDESPHERGQVGRDFHGHGLMAPMVGWSADGAAAFAEILKRFVRKIVEPPFAGVLLELPIPRVASNRSNHSRNAAKSALESRRTASSSSLIVVT